MSLGSISSQGNGNGGSQIPTNYIGPLINQGYSFRRLVPGYTGKICTIWNGSTYSDFYLNGDYVDVSAIQTFLNGNTGVLSKFYCQKSGNYFQSMASNKSWWFEVLVIGGEITLQSDNFSSQMRPVVSPLNGDTISFVLKCEDSQGLLLNAGAGRYLGAMSGQSNVSYSAVGSPTTYINNNQITDTRNNIRIATNTAFAQFSYRNIDLPSFGLNAYFNNYGGWQWKGKYKEFIIADSLNAAAIEQDQINYYNL